MKVNLRLDLVNLYLVKYFFIFYSLYRLNLVDRFDLVNKRSLTTTFTKSSLGCTCFEIKIVLQTLGGMHVFVGSLALRDILHKQMIPTHRMNVINVEQTRKVHLYMICTTFVWRNRPLKCWEQYWPLTATIHRSNSTIITRNDFFCHLQYIVVLTIQYEIIICKQSK